MGNETATLNKKHLKKCLS